jgi:hypothetical protein
MNNDYEQELLLYFAKEIATGTLIVKPDSKEVFVRLGRAFPSHCGKIDWTQVPDAVRTVEIDRALESKTFLGFFADCVTRFQPAGDVMYVNDNCIDLLLKFNLKELLKLAPTFLTMPAHHYFIAIDYSWCACCTMEGDMDFGLRPTLRRE